MPTLTPRPPVPTPPPEGAGHFTRVYAAYGAAFGALFPIGATLFEAAVSQDLSISGLIAAQTNQPLLWVIDTAPVWLGLFAAFGGYRQDSLVHTYTTLEHTHNALEAAHDSLERAHHDLEAKNAELRGANTELRRAQQLKAEFLANVSHELRTPLNAIIGFTRILIRKTKDTLDDRQKKNLRMVHESGLHLLEIVNDLLDIERIEAGTLAVKVEVVAIADLVDEMMASVKPKADEKGLTLGHSVDPAVGKLNTDSVRLRQTLLNLVVNAIKYSDSGHIQVDVTLQDDDVRFAVADQGIGIAADQLHTVFEAFRQVDGSHTRAQGGVGLGLHLVKQLSALLGGTVEAESEQGVGSTFTLKLPRALQVQETRKQPSTEIVGPEDGTGPLVLAIDDQPNALEIVQTELVDAGFRVAIAFSGEEGLERAHELRPDIIVLDIIMPAMDGWAVLKEIRKSPDISSTPVIISSFLDAAPIAMEMGSVAWLTKPFAVDAFRGVLRSLDLNGHADILVVEDDTPTRNLIVEQLSELELNMRTAADGQAGLDAIAESMPDAVILDLNLPKLDGFAVLERIRQMPEGASLPVVVYTARDLDARELARLDRGAAAVVAKGMTHSVVELASRVRQALADKEPTP